MCDLYGHGDVRGAVVRHHVVALGGDDGWAQGHEASPCRVNVQTAWSTISHWSERRGRWTSVVGYANDTLRRA